MNNIAQDIDSKIRNITDEQLKSSVIKEYKDVLFRNLKLLYPTLRDLELTDAINWSINKRFYNATANIYNNYNNTNIKSNILDLCNYILDRKPIMTSQGVLFHKHGELPNPIFKLIDGFIADRKKMKKEMFKHPKGSEDYEKYNLLQLLLKIDANGFYGVLGQHTSLYFNLHVANSITTQGRSCISSAALLFESFFNNNVPFGSLDEVVTFIDNVKREERKYSDSQILDNNITIEECFRKVMGTCGFGFIPDEEDCLIVWNILCGSSQQDLNRLFYKNNLFGFMDNSSMQKAIKYLLCSLDYPFLDPNSTPKIIKAELEEFWSLLKEFVYYDKQIIDRTDKLDVMYRSVVAIIDTDSNIISVDGWYRYVLNVIKDTPMRIKTQIIDPVESYEEDEFGDRDLIKVAEFIETPSSYDFENDEIIAQERFINPTLFTPQDGLRFSIVNIIAYCISQMINDFMIKYTINSNSYRAEDGPPCFLVMKNEFFFGRALITPAKKNYATTQLMQEGHRVAKDQELDVKGLPAFTKSTMNETTRKRLKRILYEDIMNGTEIDQLKILQDLAKFEKEIYNSIQNGEKIYYKPARIKSIAAYDDPMRIQGIKAAYAYNYIHSSDTETIDLNTRNSVSVIKVDITPKNVDKIALTYPEQCLKMKELMKTRHYDTGIDVIALPLNESVPKWVLPFITYATIISDNLSLFPLESIGIYRGNKNNARSNILQM